MCTRESVLFAEGFGRRVLSSILSTEIVAAEEETRRNHDLEPSLNSNPMKNASQGSNKILLRKGRRERRYPRRRRRRRRRILPRLIRTGRQQRFHQTTTTRKGPPNNKSNFMEQNTEGRITHVEIKKPTTPTISQHVKKPSTPKKTPSSTTTFNATGGGGLDKKWVAPDEGAFNIFASNAQVRLLKAFGSVGWY